MAQEQIAEAEDRERTRPAGKLHRKTVQLRSSYRTYELVRAVVPLALELDLVQPCRYEYGLYGHLLYICTYLQL
jgi:hypothetical protein